ncbi:MAG: hypothetical protein ABH882_00085 [Candidatus Omnitrophota bacterium]|nr:hypothetical protein [Candidatus Omnitrophota bacterium]MBU1928626.1 hypothetical protein [Candidatus Omnitrophota bacterium]MBU2034756.1 hypothetical protein [Candidatus Omnitrophota bacterium]MBU2221827.1 hypothetical protein [Candidatus Omnitrophota bacterium]MBU2258474.1 hypothetical protein [Candidatus Omnitrophota bacterium]
MAGKIRISVIIFCVLLFAAISFGAWAFLNFQSERKQNILLQQDLDKLKQETKKIEVRLEDTRKANAGLHIKFQEANKKIVSLSDEIENEKKLQQDILNQSDQLRLDMEKQIKERLDLERKLEVSQQEVKSLTEQLKELNFNKKEMEDKAKDNSGTDQKVELGKIVVAPETPSAAVSQQRAKAGSEGKGKPAFISGLEAKVLVINKDYNFVVLNVGSKDNIAVGDVFSLFHNNKPIGDVSVEKVHEAMTAAGFLNPETKDTVREGDKAVLKDK